MTVTHAQTLGGAVDDPAYDISKDEYVAAHTVGDGSFVAAKLSATATDKVFGRSTAGAGNGEEIALTAAGRALIDDANVAAQLVTLGLVAAPAGELGGTLAATTVNATHSGSAHPVAASDTVAGTIELAIQSEQETGTDVVRAVTPGRQHFHPSAAKFWCQTTGAGTPANASSYNVTSIADTAVGRMTVTIATDFSAATWCSVCGGASTGATVTLAALQWIGAKAAGTVEVVNCDASATPVVEDPAVGYNVAGFGDLA